MGHNDHINFDLHDSMTEMVERGIMEEGSEEWQLLSALVDGEKDHNSLSPADKKLYETSIVPMLEALAKEQEDEAMAYKLSKDD